MQKALRVLLVDDNEALRENLVECLEEEGHQVASARDGQEALGHLARSERPDVLVVDLVMPGLSGRDVAAAVRRDPGLRDVRVVLMTGREATAGGWPEFDAVLTKPFGLPELLAAVRSEGATPSA